MILNFNSPPKATANEHTSGFQAEIYNQLNTNVLHPSAWRGLKQTETNVYTTTSQISGNLIWSDEFQEKEGTSTNTHHGSVHR